MSTNINFYENKAVKKKNPKRPDEQLEHTGIKLRSRVLLCGASGSGKTNALLNYIHLSSKPRRGTFRHIFLAYKTDEPLYDVLIDKLKDKITVIKDLANLPPVESFQDSPDYDVLFIFDDVVNDVKNKKYLKNVENYFAFGRKKALTIFFLTQSYFQTQIFFRDNCNNIILLSIESNKDLRRIIGEFSTKSISGDQIVNMFEYATKEPLSFLKITPSYDTPDNKKFSKNWLNYLDPNNSLALFNRAILASSILSKKT